MAKSLTQLAIDNLKPGPARREVPDGKEGGLYFVVQATGAKSWALRYRFGGKPRKFTIGPYPQFSLAKARAEASRAKVSIVTRAPRKRPPNGRKRQRGKRKAI